jgi:hypothetical protein
MLAGCEGSLARQWMRLDQAERTLANIKRPAQPTICTGAVLTPDSTIKKDDILLIGLH